MQYLQQHPQIMLIGGLLLIGLFFASRIARRFTRRPTTVLSSHEQVERNKQSKAMRGDLEQLMVEIQQMTQRLGSQLDTKATRIEHLLQQADARIQTLQKCQSEASPRETSPKHEVTQPPVSHDHAAPMPSISSSRTSHGNTSPAAEGLPDDPLARNVYQLADQGKDLHQIARTLDEHVGKVELILALRNA